MATTKTEAEKAALVRAWIDEQHRAGITQAEFARRHGIGERTLRAYVAAHAPRSGPTHQLREILAETLCALQRVVARLDQLDAAAAAEPAVVVPSTSVTAAPAATTTPSGREVNTSEPKSSRQNFWD